MAKADISLQDLLNQEPPMVLHGVGKNKENYQYVPISAVLERLDAIFDLHWSFDLDREVFGKGAITAKGTLTCVYKGEKVIVRAGVAAVQNNDGVKLDYPSLKSHVLMNAAKSLGKVFGRDLNKEAEDMIGETEDAIDRHFESIRDALLNAKTKVEAESMLEKSSFKYAPDLKILINEKFK